MIFEYSDVGSRKAVSGIVDGVSVCGCSFSEDPPKVFSFLVQPEFRGRGYGRELAEEVGLHMNAVVGVDYRMAVEFADGAIDGEGGFVGFTNDETASFAAKMVEEFG